MDKGNASTCIVYYMDIYFNDLSLQPYNSATLNARVTAYANLISKCYAELKFEKVRYALDLGLINIDNNLSLSASFFALL